MKKGLKKLVVGSATIALLSVPVVAVTSGNGNGQEAKALSGFYFGDWNDYWDDDDDRWDDFEDRWDNDWDDHWDDDRYDFDDYLDNYYDRWDD